MEVRKSGRPPAGPPVEPTYASPSPHRLRLLDGATLPIQPHPEETSIIVTPRGEWTSLLRHWAPGATARCRLCPEGSCVASPRGSCHMVVPGVVAEADAPLYSTVGIPRRVGVGPA